MENHRTGWGQGEQGEKAGAAGEGREGGVKENRPDCTEDLNI